MLLNAMDVVTGKGYALPEGLRTQHSDPGTVDFHFCSGFWKHLNLGMTHEILLRIKKMALSSKF